MAKNKKKVQLSNLILIEWNKLVNTSCCFMSLFTGQRIDFDSTDRG